MSEKTKVRRVPEFPEDLVRETLELLAETDNYKKGANEVTKTLSRTIREDERYDPAKLIIIADDVSPPEVTFHLPNQARKAGVPFVVVPSQDELGKAINIKRTACVAVFDEDAFSKVIENASAIVSLPEEEEEN